MLRQSKTSAGDEKAQEKSLSGKLSVTVEADSHPEDRRKLNRKNGIEAELVFDTKDEDVTQNITHSGKDEDNDNNADVSQGRTLGEENSEDDSNDFLELDLNELENFNWEGFEVVDELGDANEASAVAKEPEKKAHESSDANCQSQEQKVETGTKTTDSKHGSPRGRSPRRETKRSIHRNDGHRKHATAKDRKRSDNQRLSHDEKEPIRSERHEESIIQQNKFVGNDRRKSFKRNFNAFSAASDTRHRFEDSKINMKRCTSDEGKARRTPTIKRASCRSNLKDFKRVLVISDGRVQFDSSVMKIGYTYNHVQVLIKPFLTFDEVPNLITERVDLTVPKETLLICSVGTFNMIEVEDCQACHDLSDHKPLKCVHMENKDSEYIAKELINKTKEVRKEVQQLLGKESEIYFTTIFPGNLLMYQKYQLKLHGESTEHEVDIEFMDSDLKNWKNLVFQTVNSFNEYINKNCPPMLSLRLADHALCLAKESKEFFKTNTVDGLNLTPEICTEMSYSLLETVKKYLKWQGRYEKVVFVGDSRLEHVRKAWPRDVRYNCKILTDPDLQLKHLCDANDPMVKELSTLRYSLIVISLGINDLCKFISHDACVSHKKLEVLVPAHMFHDSNITHIRNNICNNMLGLEANLKAVTHNCDIVFTPMHDLDLVAHQNYVMNVHQKEVDHKFITPVFDFESKFKLKYIQMLRVIRQFNKVSHLYSKAYPHEVGNFPYLIPDRVLLGPQNNVISSIRSEILYDGVHPSQDMARKMAETYRIYADEVLKLKCVKYKKSLYDPPAFSHLRNIITYKCKNMSINSRKGKREDYFEDTYCSPQHSHIKENNASNESSSNSSHNVDIRSSLSGSPRRSSKSPSNVQQKRRCSKSPSALLSDVSDTDSDLFNEIVLEPHIKHKTGPPSEPPTRPGHRYPKPTKVPGTYTNEIHYQKSQKFAKRTRYLTEPHVNRYTRSPSPVLQKRYQRSLSLRERNCLRSPSPSFHVRKYMKSSTSASHKVYQSSPSPLKQEKRYPWSPPLPKKSYSRSISLRERSRSRSVSPFSYGRNYERSMSSFTEKGSLRSLSPSKQGKRHLHRSFSRSPSSNGRSYSRPLSRSPSLDRIRYRSSSKAHENKALASLREVHNRECAVYRKHPVAHPDYEKELKMYKHKKFQCIINLGGDPNTYDINRDWEKFWSTRLEEILEVSWDTKKKKCLAMLQRKKSPQDSSSEWDDDMEEKHKEGYTKHRKLKKKKRSRCRSSSRDSRSPLACKGKGSKRVSKSKKRKSRAESNDSPVSKKKYSSDEVSGLSSEGECLSDIYGNEKKYISSDDERMSEVCEKIQDKFDKLPDKSDQIQDSREGISDMPKRVTEQYDVKCMPGKYQKLPEKCVNKFEKLPEKCVNKYESTPENYVSIEMAKDRISDILSGERLLDKHFENDAEKSRTLKCEQEIPRKYIESSIAMKITKHVLSDNKQMRSIDEGEIKKKAIAEPKDATKYLCDYQHKYSFEDDSNQPTLNVQPLKGPRLNMLPLSMKSSESDSEQCSVQTIAKSIEELRNTPLHKSLMQPAKKEESADEVSSTTPSFEDRKQEDVIEVLEILNRLSEKLGVLKIPLKVVYDKALKYKAMGRLTPKLCSDKDTKTLLYMISSKLRKLACEENLTVIQKVIIQEADERLDSLLKAAGPDLDVSLIAEKCLAKNESDTIADIQSQFLFHGMSAASHEQIKEVYDAVKLEKSKLLMKILKRTNVGDVASSSPSSNVSIAPPCGSGIASFSTSQVNFSFPLKDEQNTRAKQSARSYSEQISDSKESFQSKQQFSSGIARPSDVSSSIFSSEVCDSPAKDHLSLALAKLSRSMLGSSSHESTVEKTGGSGTWLSSTLDYGLPTPSTSKIIESDASRSSQSPCGGESVGKSMQVNVAGKESTLASTLTRKDPIRLVIPKAKTQGGNMRSSSPSVDDSGW